MSVTELQAAVSQLSTEELDRFSEWFEEFVADRRQSSWGVWAISGGLEKTEAKLGTMLSVTH